MMSESSEERAIKALVTAVENTKSNGRDDNDEYNCQQLLHLFQPSNRCDALVQGNTSKQQQTLLWNALKKCSTDKNNKNRLKRFFSGMKSILERIIVDEAFVPDSVKEKEEEEGNNKENSEGNNDDDDDDDDVQSDKRSDECLLVLKYAALAVQAYLNGRIIREKEKEKEQQRRVALKVPPQVLEVACALHGILFALHSCGAPAGPTKTATLHLCESWWLSQAEHRESLIAQCLPLLLLNSCEDTDKFTTKSHIIRLYKLRHAFGCIDFADPSSDSLRQLLLRVASNPLCLKLPEGKKFLATLLQQDVNLVKDLHLAFRAQIPEAKSSILQSYGEIYHRAWKEVRENQEDDSNEDDEDDDKEETMTIRSAIEHQVLQDLMHSVIHVAAPGTFQSILTVLEPLHADKKNKEVANLLFRLYSPILWRSLSATNPVVRKNAVTILEKVFPLQDPLNRLQTNSMKDSVLKATEAMQVALQDADPAVRVAASGATARSCAMFWDALPSQEIRSLLNHIVIEHASDSRSALVRAAALDAVTTLLDAKQSHGVLRALLPSLGNLIHDKAEKVRLAAVKMLIKVKDAPGIRFYHVVPVDQLSARFVTEAKLHSSVRNRVATELTALMLNSYFPQGQNMSGSQQLKRTLAFLLTDPSAALVFYANLASHLQVESVVKLILMLFTCLKTSVDSDQANQVKHSQKQKKRRRRVSEEDSSDNQDEDSSGGNLSAANTPLMASIAETINALWESVVILLEKPKSLACKKVLEDRFADKDCLVDIIAHFEQKGIESLVQQSSDESRRIECFRTCSSLLTCATRLDETSNKKIASLVLSSLKSVSKEESESVIPLVTSYFAFLCESNFVDDVAKSMARSIIINPVEDVSIFSPGFEETLGIRRSRRSSSASRDRKEGNIPILPNVLSWGVLEYILQGVSPEGRAIRQAILSSKSATHSLEKALEKGIKLAEKLLDDSSDRNFGNEEVEYVIRASEAYGRFALHKESVEALKNDDKTSMDRQVGKLLLWTTNKIIPAFLKPDDDGVSTLRDCDLSRITTLSESLVHAEPGSPSLASPLKQKANRGRTPEAMRGPSSLFVTSPNDSPVIISAKVASVLLLSSCMISSEMLAMGMSSADEISKAAVGWSQVFDQPPRAVEKQLLCAFIRLGFQLYRASGDSTLLDDLLIKCNSRFKEKEVEDVITKVLVSLLRMRNGTNDLLSIFFTVTDRIIQQMGDASISFETASCSSEVWNEGGTIEILLDIILKNAAVALSLAREIVKKLVSHEGETTAVVNFNAKCLSLVMRQCGGPELSTVISDLEAQNYQEDGDMRLLVESLLECSA